MDHTDYEYRGLMAEAWDVLRGDTSGWSDRQRYLELIRRAEGEPVLDVGCGTGRLLLDFLALHIDIDGIDNSPEMLAICRQKAAAQGLHPNLYQQALESLDLPRRYRTILIPSSTLQLLLTPEAVREALQRVLAHLEPGGMVAASVMALWQPGAPLSSTTESAATRASDGAVFRRINTSTYDPQTGYESTEDWYQLLRDGVLIAEEHHHRSPAVRTYTQEEVVTLFAEAGCSPVQVFGGFTNVPATADDRVFTVVAYKPGAAA